MKENMQDKNILNNINKLIDDLKFFNYFDSYVLSHPGLVEKFAIQNHCDEIGHVFFLLLSDAFCTKDNKSIYSKKNANIGMDILCYYKPIDGAKRNFLYNKKRSSLCPALSVINNEFQHNEKNTGYGIANLLSYFQIHGKLCNKDINNNKISDNNAIKQDFVSCTMNLYKHLEATQVPKHLITQKEENNLEDRLNQINKTMKEEGVCFRNFYRFCNEHGAFGNMHKITEKCENMAQRALHKIGKKLPCTKNFEVKLVEMCQKISGKIDKYARGII